MKNHDRPLFRLQTENETSRAIALWVAHQQKAFDEEFGLCLNDPASTVRWQARLGPPANARGYHGVAQDSTYFALSLLRLGEQTGLAKKIIGRILEAQVRNPANRYHGAFKLIYEAKGDDVLDGNTSFFVQLGLIPAVQEYAEVLGEELCGQVRAALALLLPQRYERSLSIGYTNAWLGHIATGLAVAEMAGNQAALAACRQHFIHTYNVYMARGIAERLSMTYYMVDIAALGMICRYVQDEAIRARAGELLAIFLQELLFFEDRQPLPARRTYNDNTGAALKWSPLDWLLGALPGGADRIGEICDRRLHYGGFIAQGGWLAVLDLLTRRVVDPGVFTLPAPREMRGRFVDDIGYTSYFHQDFTLGSFDYWPSPATANQHPSDMPVAFAGAAEDLVYFGAYSMDAGEKIQAHPGTNRVGMPSAAGRPRLSYIAAQRANACCVLTNIRGYAGTFKEYGWMLRGLQYHGKLFDSRGKELNGAGELGPDWFFLSASGYLAGIYPLTHYDPIPTEWLRHSPTTLRYLLDATGLTILAPAFHPAAPAEFKGNNWPAGAILVLGSARESSLEAFQNACRQAVIEDEWYVDGFIVRNGYRDCERRVGLKMPGGELRLAFDYQMDKVVWRTFNGRPLDPPRELSAIRPGIFPWAGAQTTRNSAV